eukprot:2645069-Ditylum_brightwellii.AAC.1
MYNICSILLSLSLFIGIFFRSDAADKRQLTRGRGSKERGSKERGSMMGEGPMKRVNCLTVNIDAALGENFREFWLPIIDDSTPTVGDKVIRHAFLCEGDESSGDVIGELTNILTTIDITEGGEGQTFLPGQGGMSQTFAVDMNWSFDSDFHQRPSVGF